MLFLVLLDCQMNVHRSLLLFLNPHYQMHFPRSEEDITQDTTNFTTSINSFVVTVKVFEDEMGAKRKWKERKENTGSGERKTSISSAHNANGKDSLNP